MNYIGNRQTLRLWLVCPLPCVIEVNSMWNSFVFITINFDRRWIQLKNWRLGVWHSSLRAVRWLEPVQNQKSKRFKKDHYRLDCICLKLPQKAEILPSIHLKKELTRASPGLPNPPTRVPEKVLRVIDLIIAGEFMKCCWTKFRFNKSKSNALIT